MLIDKPYLNNYFSNIISEKWFFKNLPETSLDKEVFTTKFGSFRLNTPVQRSEITFDYNQIELMIFDEFFKDEHYLIGKCPSYFFLAIRKDEDEYPWVKIFKNITLAPMLKEMSYFSEMFPNVKKGDFANKLLLSNKLEEELIKIESEPKKVRKI